MEIAIKVGRRCTSSYFSLQTETLYPYLTKSQAGELGLGVSVNQSSTRRYLEDKFSSPGWGESEWALDMPFPTDIEAEA